MRRKLFLAFALFGFLYIAKGQDNFTVFTNTSQTTRAFNLFSLRFSSTTTDKTVRREVTSDSLKTSIYMISEYDTLNVKTTVY